ncbi:hypothetical protein ASL14_18945 [Paenibacillus sp. IHB B 3084]|uniref:hypothetical protein n=1 Tax=Paenibacillus sp. IHB B 3084 TaxID=867076 RepID=UPI000722EAD1|nr:hypothetical protein [Paenibacillus sp. IHB B 3084]ALP37951.1 hypothetical protein ASL14_18945 [Paenibacillus sp. IHB B 3084]
MEITKNVRIQFSFGESDDEDTHEVDLQISWDDSKIAKTSAAIKKSLDEAVQKWVEENVSYKWEEVEEEES